MPDQQYSYIADCPKCVDGHIIVDVEINTAGHEVVTKLLCQNCNGTGKVVEWGFTFEAPGMGDS